MRELMEWSGINTTKFHSIPSIFNKSKNRALYYSIPSHSIPYHQSKHSLNFQFIQNQTKLEHNNQKFHFHKTNKPLSRTNPEFKSPTNAKNALSFFHWSTKTHRFQHSLQSYTITINLLLQANLITDAKALLESLINKNTEIHTVRAVIDSFININTHTSGSKNTPVFDLVVKTYAKARLTDAAFSVCRYVDERGICVGLSSFNELLHVSQKCNRFSTVWDVYGYMIGKIIYSNLVTLRIMIDALCKEGLLQRNVDVLDRIIGKRNSHSPSIVVNSSLILRMLEEEKEECEVVNLVTLLKRLLQKNSISDLVAYSLIFHVKVRLGNLDDALEMYGEMVRRGFSENSFVYTSFIRAFCEKGRVDEAIGLMREMEGKGLKPYGETFECVIVGCADSGRLKECWSVFEEMLSAGLVPSCLVFDKVVEKVCENGEVEKVNDMLTVLLDKGFVPSDVTYSNLIHGYARNDEIQGVLKIYYEMEYKSMCPGLSVFSSMIQCLCRLGKVVDAEKYLRIMKGRSLTPNVTIYETLIDCHVQKGNDDRAIQLRNEMKSSELQHS